MWCWFYWWVVTIKNFWSQVGTVDEPYVSLKQILCQLWKKTVHIVCMCFYLFKHVYCLHQYGIKRVLSSGDHMISPPFWCEVSVPLFAIISFLPIGKICDGKMSFRHSPTILYRNPSCKSVNKCIHVTVTMWMNCHRSRCKLWTNCTLYMYRKLFAICIL